MRKKNGYTDPALTQARTSPYRVLITDIESLHNDLLNYPLQESKDILKEILRKFERYEKKEKKINKVLKELICLKRSIKEQERRKDERIYYFLYFLLVLLVAMSCIIFLLINE